MTAGVYTVRVTGYFKGSIHTRINMRFAVCADDCAKAANLVDQAYDFSNVRDCEITVEKGPIDVWQISGTVRAVRKPEKENRPS